ncbi:UNVERIFIED_CONTAM: hypothetical protein FKN15_028765 [Acipenser sinensis]
MRDTLGYTKITKTPKQTQLQWQAKIYKRKEKHTVPLPRAVGIYKLNWNHDRYNGTSRRKVNYASGALSGAGGREAVASEPALTPEHALTTEHNTAQRTPHDPPRRRAQFRARRIVV